MRIGVCDGNADSRKQLLQWIQAYCGACGADSEITGFRTAEELYHASSLRRFSVVFIALDGPEGFLSARRFRETDKRVKLVFISDTDRFAVNGVRLHFTDYIVRPAELRHIVRAMKLSGIPGEV